MNAISYITATPRIETSMSTMLSSGPADNDSARSHAHMRATLDHVVEWRRKVMTARSHMKEAAKEYRDRSSSDLERLIEQIEAEERDLVARRKDVLALRNSVRAALRKNKSYLLPSVNRLSFVFNLGLIELLELLRDTRLEATAELASRPQEPDGPILSSPAEVAKYFADLLAA